jgi:ribosomal protein S18 acetylase RimI-like enzyme
MEMSLVQLDPRNTADIDGVISLHIKYLGESPVVKMGRRFLREFYYRRLVEDGLIGCTLCRVGDEVVGFISYTDRPQDFMSIGLRRHFIYLSWLMSLSVLARPAMVTDLMFVLKLMRARAREAGEVSFAGSGEALSMAVMPEYQNYVPEGGRKRLAVRLFESAVEYCKAKGSDRIHLWVQPSNRAANLFYSAMGCPFEKMVIAGVPVHLYTYWIKDSPGS